MTPEFHSQFGEDRILAELFRNAGNGFCVEVGANDGINDSTTYHFEQLGWDCVLVEPNPELCAKIRLSRRARLFECAASSVKGSATLYVAEGADRAHGVSGIGSEAGNRKRIASHGFSARPVQVATRKLDDLLDEVGDRRPLHFISIDVEGHEVDVLKGFSLDRWKPAVILAEDNFNYSNRLVRRYLRRYDYVPFRRTGVNDWYAHRSNRAIADSVNRWRWHWGAFDARARAHLKRVPGLLALHRLLRGM